VCLVQDAFEVLDVVPDLVRDHIGLGEVAGRTEAPRQLVEEIGVEVDAVVVRAIEGPHRRLPGATGGLGPARIGDELGRPVLLARLLENLPPGLLGRAQHPQQEFPRLRVERRLARGRAALRAAAGKDATAAAAKPAERAQQEIADHEDDDPTDPEPARDEREEAAEPASAEATTSEPARLAGAVFEIAAFRFAAQPHDRLPVPQP